MVLMHSNFINTLHLVEETLHIFQQGSVLRIKQNNEFIQKSITLPAKILTESFSKIERLTFFKLRTFTVAQSSSISKVIRHKRRVIAIISCCIEASYLLLTLPGPGIACISISNFQTTSSVFNGLCDGHFENHEAVVSQISYDFSKWKLKTL